MMDWMGIEGKANIEFNVDYDSVAFDPNALNAIANLSREGRFPLPYVFEALKKGEYLPNNATLQEYITLIALQESEIGVLDLFNTYQQMREGKHVEVPQVSFTEPEGAVDSQTLQKQYPQDPNEV